ncbi:MAG TPA: hypothetical protein VIN08_16735, partial [Ohtaekwangia sp.]|uniref:hypothetical protein n=1 Tax=Ohtaekwangia sp. TaxID=2066019 RepID=UPI002F95D910
MTQTLSFSDIEPCMHVHSHNSGVFTHRSSGHQSWGTLQEKFFANQHYAFKEYRLDMQRQHRVQYDEALLPRCMSICLALQGAVQVEFKDSGFAASLNSLQHHSMYAHEREYDLIIDRAIHGIHVAVDLDYYINLLGDDDRWMAALREKLVKKEHVMQGDASVSKEMLVAIQTIGNNPLKGNLGKLLTEAKILELIALQIGQFTTETKK